MKYRQIVFDIDGTLLDTEYAVLHSLQDTILYYTGKTIPTEELTFVLGITGEDALYRLGMKDIAGALDLWIRNLRGYFDTVTVFDGVTELLEKLSDMHFETGIVTSKTKEEFEREFCTFGIRHYFKTVICADDTTEHKPEPEPLLKYMELSEAGKEQMLYIGDSKYDSMCAKGAGVDFALAVWGSHDREIGADYYLEKPLDLLSEPL